MSRTSTGGSGAINVLSATGLEPAALQSPPQYTKGGAEEEEAGEWGRVKDREGERGNERGSGGVPGALEGRLCCC